MKRGTSFSNRIFLLISFLVLAGCVARGPIFTELRTPPPGKSMLYVYRTNYDKYRTDLAPNITVNGKEIGTLWLDGYLTAVVDPGMLVVRMENKAYLWEAGAPLKTVSIKIEPNNTGFVEFSIDDVNNVMASSRHMISYIKVSFSEMPERVAMKFLPKLKEIK